MKEKERNHPQPRLSVRGGELMSPVFDKRGSTPWEGLKRRYTVSVVVRGSNMYSPAV